MLLPFLLFVRLSYAQISFCDDATIIGLRICGSEDYNKGFGEARPLSIKEKIVLYDVKEFNPNEKSITLFMMLFTVWNDSRVMLKSGDPNQ